MSEKKNTQLSGSLGVTSIVLMVVATAAPLTVMVANTPLIITMGNGAGAAFDALLATLIMFLFAVGFVAMSKYISNAGAFYSYIQKGLGRTLGLGSATLAWISYFLILVALETYMGVAFSDLLKNLAGINVPWWVMTLACMLTIGFLGYRHIELSSKFLAIALVLEIAVVILVDLFVFAERGLTGMDIEAFHPATIMSGSPGLGIMFAIYCFIGFEATVIFREEAKDPDRTIPKATYIAVLGVGLFYIISMWCEVTVIGSSNIVNFATTHGESTYLLIAQQYLGTLSKDVILVLLVTSLFACALSLHNIVVRYQYVLGKYDVLPKQLAYIHEKYKSPYMSSFVQTASSITLFIFLLILELDPVTNIYAWGATTGTLGYMTILSLTCISVIVFFRRNKNGNFWKTLLAPSLGLIGLLFCLWIAIVNLPSLIGSESTLIAQIIICVLIAAFSLGVVKAKIMKSRKPQLFEQLKELA
ncbi:APC family permease [Acinetobacter terrae]|nr:APC family permease [Acinetobacter terrae]